MDLCPRCEHQRGEPRRQPPWVTLLGLRPRPAECVQSDYGDNPSGYPALCFCRHPFHGS